jgi:triacylglycerol lipase
MGTAVVGPEIAAGIEMNVVMVHGFLDTGRLYRGLGRKLEAAGHRCHAPTLHPRDGRLGIPDLAGKLADYVANHVEVGVPSAFVGFSMGAIVARYYLQEMGGVRSAKAFFSVAGPHGGAFTSYLYPGLGVRQMRPRSSFLAEMDKRVDRLEGIRMFTYRTPVDLVVQPAKSSRIAGADEVVVWCPFHALMPSDPTVIGHIAGELAKLENAPRG